MVKPKRYMRDAVRQTLLPYLASIGFNPHGSLDTDGKSPEIKRAFPFGAFKRIVGESFQIVEVQFDKYGSNKFVINFAVVPPEGVTLPWGHFPQEQLAAGSIPGSYRLHSNVRFMRWFSIGWLASDKQKSAEKEVMRVIRLFDEIEAWFACGVVGPHMRQHGYGYNGLQTSATAQPDNRSNTPLR